MTCENNLWEKDPEVARAIQREEMGEKADELAEELGLTPSDQVAQAKTARPQPSGCLLCFPVLLFRSLVKQNITHTQSLTPGVESS